MKKTNFVGDLNFWRRVIIFKNFCTCNEMLFSKNVKTIVLPLRNIADVSQPVIACKNRIWFLHWGYAPHVCGAASKYSMILWDCIQRHTIHLIGKPEEPTIFYPFLTGSRKSLPHISIFQWCLLPRNYKCYVLTDNFLLYKPLVCKFQPFTVNQTKRTNTVLLLC